jgi:D-arabinose 1-dehydrogenase-like Zn-dependent alcohol dehydrogenase
MALKQVHMLLKGQTPFGPPPILPNCEWEGTCEYCRTGWDALCLAQHNSGFSVNGSFAEYVIGSALYVGRLPDDCNFAAIAPMLCAGVTTYKAIKETEAKPGEWIVFSGVGGLGQLGIEYAKAAVDVTEQKLALARASGAEVTVNASLPDAVQQLPSRGSHPGDCGVLRKRRGEHLSAPAAARAFCGKLTETGFQVSEMHMAEFINAEQHQAAFGGIG